MTIGYSYLRENKCTHGVRGTGDDVLYTFWKFMRRKIDLHVHLFLTVSGRFNSCRMTNNGLEILYQCRIVSKRWSWTTGIASAISVISHSIVRLFLYYRNAVYIMCFSAGNTCNNANVIYLISQWYTSICRYNK
jgi:hypothetical protein